MTALREFQDRGNRFPFDRLTGGRFVLAPHDGLPDTPGRNARYDRELYVTIRFGQPKIVDGRDGISPSSLGHHGLLCSPREMQPLRARLSFLVCLKSAVASSPARPGPASQPAPASSAHRYPSPRSRSASGRAVSPHAERIQSRLHLPPSSSSPFDLVAAEPRSGNVLPRLCRCVSSCGRTAVLGHASRLSARLAPAGRPSAGDLISLRSLCLSGGVCSCRESYLLASRAPRKSPDAIVSSPTELSDVRNSATLQGFCGCRRTPLQSSRPLEKSASAPQSAGYQASKSRHTSSSKRRCTRHSSEIEVGIPEPAEGIDPRQSMTGGPSERPSMVVKQRGESEAGVTGAVNARALRLLASRASADPDAVEGACVCSARLARHQSHSEPGLITGAPCRPALKSESYVSASTTETEKPAQFTIAGGAASAGSMAAGRISNGSPGAPLARCDSYSSIADL